MPTPLLVRQPAKVHMGEEGAGQEDQHPGSWAIRVPLSVCPVPPLTGFKLAFNYLKDKRFVEAIEVCHNVSHCKAL